MPIFMTTYVCGKLNFQGIQRDRRTALRKEMDGDKVTAHPVSGKACITVYMCLQKLVDIWHQNDVLLTMLLVSHYR